MKEETVTMSHRNLDRLMILKKVLEKELTQEKASNLLKITSRQVRKLLSRLKNEGPKGIISRLIGKRSNRSKSQDFKHHVINLIKEKYVDFRPKLATEKLAEIDGLKISSETVRKWMIENLLWIPRKQRKKIHMPRPRRECFGELIQGDGSSHKWFGEDQPEATAIVLIDDATSAITGLFFSEGETLEAYYSALRQHFKKYGLPRALYTDRFSIFCSPNKRGETQMQRALKELNIELILAKSPQAKGKVERANQTLQDRLVKEFRLRGIKTIEAANEYAEEYLRGHNHLFSKKPMSAYDAHRPLEGYDLNQILAWKEMRSLDSSAIFQFNKTYYQIQGVSELRRLNKRKIEVRTTSDGSMRVFLEGREYKVLPLNQIMDQPMELTRKEIQQWKPRTHAVPITHPWKIGLQRELIRKRMTMV